MTGFRVGALAPLAFGLVLGIAPAQEQQPNQAPHGAMAFDAQQQELARLQPSSVGEVPRGVDLMFWRVFAPTPATPAQVALGKRLYFDPRLSADDSVSCATCHDVSRSFTDRRPVSEGIRGQLGRRNAPTTMNAVLVEPLFWDGRAPTLANQAGQPILNPVEMGMKSRDDVVAKLKGIEDYPQAFQDTFGRPLDYQGIEDAIAAFERTLVFLDAPFDRYQAGDDSAISAAAKRGLELFNGKARCATCHPINPTNPLGTDYRFHNVGVSARHQDFEKLAGEALEALSEDPSQETLDRLAIGTDLSELGRFMVTKNYADVGAFRTPQIRNVGITAPYMHDGSMQTLWDVMDHYNKGGETNSWLDGGIEALALTEDEIDDLVAFLFTLTDVRFQDLNQEQMQQQRARAQKQRPFRDDELAMRKKLVFEDRVQQEGDKR